MGSILPKNKLICSQENCKIKLASLWGRRRRSGVADGCKFAFMSFGPAWPAGKSSLVFSFPSCTDAFTLSVALAVLSGDTF